MTSLLPEPVNSGCKARLGRQRKAFGNLLQHDDSPNRWWSGEKFQILAQTIDGTSHFIVGAGFIKAETTFDRLAHIRKIFLTDGPPNDIDTEALSHFGHESRKVRDTDTLSHFQRALGCLGDCHLVAEDPQSQAKSSASLDSGGNFFPPSSP
jgi:hypothetical protein